MMEKIFISKLNRNYTKKTAELAVLKDNDSIVIVSLELQLMQWCTQCHQQGHREISH